MLSAERGYKFVAIVDKHAPADKLNSILAYGAKLHFAPKKEGDKGGHLVDVRRTYGRKNWLKKIMASIWNHTTIRKILSAFIKL